MTVQLSQEAWSFIASKLEEGPLNKKLTAICGLISKQTGYSVPQIRGHKKTPPDLVKARWLVMREAAQQGVSLSAIGRYMNKDHKSVSHGIQQCEAIMRGERS